MAFICGASPVHHATFSTWRCLRLIHQAQAIEQLQAALAEAGDDPKVAALAEKAMQEMASAKTKLDAVGDGVDEDSVDEDSVDEDSVDEDNEDGEPEEENLSMRAATPRLTP